MNIGFIVKDLGNSETIYDLIKEIGEASEKTNSISPCIFFQNLVPNLLIPYCLSMNITGLSNFTGHAVAIDLEAALLLDNNISNTTNWVYITNLEWLNSVLNFEICSKTLEGFKIVARSESHKKIIKNFTGRDDIYLAKDISELYKCLTL